MTLSVAKNRHFLIDIYTHSISRAATPTNNGCMEEINRWLKEELFTDFYVKNSENIDKFIEEYINYFNNESPLIRLII